jgi:hypothetical protein
MDGDDEDQGHSINDDYRMAGLRGDDESDLEADQEELFGAANDPIDVDAADGGDAGGAAGGAAGDDAGGAAGDGTVVNGPKKRKCTSDAWNDFEKIFEVIDGKPVRTGAKCFHCGKYYAARSSIGTGHLNRHVLSCPERKKNVRSSQSLLSFNANGSVRHWEYSADVARTQLCRLIARLDLPLCIGETAAFEEYIKLAHNPRFSGVSRQTTTRDMEKYFTDCRAKLITSLASVSSVAITSDIWSGNAKEDYLSVVAHYVNADWQLEKRIIGLRLIDVSHSGQNIADRVVAVLEEYGLIAKTFSVTLDNASANTTAITKMSPKLSEYVGTLLLHQRFACHIINLIVKSALDVIKKYLEAFRTAISFINSSNQRIAAFKRYCIAVNVRPRKFGLDMDVRWNSTYLMLKHLVPYRQTFSVFIETNYPRGEDEPLLLTDDHWTVAEKVLSFLELFYESTVQLSGVYYPTAPLMLHHLILICKHLKANESDKLLRPVVLPMQDVYLKYWRDIPMLYSFAFILDPRAKLKGFHNVLRLLSRLTGTDYSGYFTEVRASLADMFKKYDAKFGAVKLTPPEPPSTGKRKTAWDDIFSSAGDDDVASDIFSSPGNSFCTPLSICLEEHLQVP